MCLFQLIRILAVLLLICTLCQRGSWPISRFIAVIEKISNWTSAAALWATGPSTNSSLVSTALILSAHAGCERMKSCLLAALAPRFSLSIFGSTSNGTFVTSKQLKGLCGAGELTSTAFLHVFFYDLDCHRIDISPVITHRFPLSKFEDAFACLFSGAACKIVLDPQT